MSFEECFNLDSKVKRLRELGVLKPEENLTNYSQLIYLYDNEIMYALRSGALTAEQFLSSSSKELAARSSRPIDERMFAADSKVVKLVELGVITVEEARNIKYFQFLILDERMVDALKTGVITKEQFLRAKVDTELAGIVEALKNLEALWVAKVGTSLQTVGTKSGEEAAATRIAGDVSGKVLAEVGGTKMPQQGVSATQH